MNYKRLIKDSRNGDIDWDVFQLAVDNDCGYWDLVDYEDDEQRDQMCGAMEEKYGTPDGYNDVVRILQACGINAEWV